MVDIRLIKFDENRVYSAKELAYIGDAIFDILIKSYILNKKKYKKSLHQLAIKYVNANFQEKLLFKILDSLNEKELAIYKNGRNQKFGTKPKNASAITYRHATAFETVIGYWYINNNSEKIVKLLNIIEEIENEENVNNPNN